MKIWAGKKKNNIACMKKGAAYAAPFFIHFTQPSMQRHISLYLIWAQLIVLPQFLRDSIL